MKSIKVGEILRTGDEYQDPHDRKWYPTKCAGRMAGIPNCTSLRYRRPIGKGGAK